MSLLFQPVQFGSLQLKNKIVIAPMCQYSATEQGEITYWHEQQWANYALSGAGLCIVEATAVQPEGRISYADLGLWNDQQASQIKTLLQKVKSISPMPLQFNSHMQAVKLLQINLGVQGQFAPDHSLGWQTVSVSDIPFQAHEHPPKSLSVDEIQQVIQDFAASAKRAVEAGFELIELHAAHGYLLHQFMSPLSNHRQDQYGGSFENRIRLTLEVFEAIKAAVPEDFPIGVRISATDWMDGVESWDVESSVELSKELEKLGAVYIHVSSAGLHVDQKIDVHPNYQVPFAEAIKRT